MAELVPVGCSGTATDGVTDCATNFALQLGETEADCNQNIGAGCNCNYADSINAIQSASACVLVLVCFVPFLV